jgi:hypothetical protein
MQGFRRFGETPRLDHPGKGLHCVKTVQGAPSIVWISQTVNAKLARLSVGCKYLQWLHQLK